MKRNFLLFSFLLNAVLLQFGTSFAQLQTQRLSQEGNLYFLENKGQITDQFGYPRKDIDFKLSAKGVSAFIGDAQIHYQWAKAERSSIDARAFLNGDAVITSTVYTYRMDVMLEGANKQAVSIAEDMSEYSERYFLSGYDNNGVTEKSYRKIIYKDIYPKIDWVIYVKGNSVEYDFVVHPGGDVRAIKLRYDGATAMNINDNGSITAKTPMGAVTEQAPYSFREDGTTVASSFELKDRVLSFKTGSYEGTLTIDPLLAWATYYGGDPVYFDECNSVKTDKSGNVYIAGFTSAPNNIATTGSFQTAVSGMGDAYLAKFSSAGARLWATYYGGTGQEGLGNPGYSIVCDTLDNVYLAAASPSSITSIVTAGSHQTTYGGGSFDVFLVKFNGEGIRQWATYYGGTGSDMVSKFGLASDGEYIYMSGTTESATAIATPGSHKDTISGRTDLFLVKFNASGVRQWATYYGGLKNEVSIASIACDRAGNIYMTGATTSVENIATPGSHQPTSPYITTGVQDAFIVKFDAQGERKWGTYYGGEKQDVATGVACDDSMNVIITGTTSSTGNIASAGAYQDTCNGTLDIFITKFDSAGVRKWSTYYGGEGRDNSGGIDCGANGKIFIAGTTTSTTAIATADGYQTDYRGKISRLLPDGGDGLMTVFNASGEKEWSTYYGGPDIDFTYGIVYDKRGYVYVCGNTLSDTGIATPGSYQDTLPGVMPTMISLQSFVAKFCYELPEPAISGDDTVYCRNTQTYHVTGSDDASYIWELPSGWSGASTSESIIATSGTEGGTIKVWAIRCNDTVTSQFDVHVVSKDPAVITINGFELGTVVPYDSYQWFLNGQPISGATQSTYNVTQNGDYTVATADAGGCTDTSDIYTVTNVSIHTAEGPEASVFIYPNPAQKKVYIQSPIAVQITISNPEGKLMVRDKACTEVDISMFPAGIYVMTISDKDGHLLKREKLIKLK